MALLIALGTAAAAGSLFPAVAGAVERANGAFDDAASFIRRDPLVDVTREVYDAVGSVWVWRTLSWATLGVLVAVRRLRHLAVYVAVILTVTTADGWLGSSVADPSDRVLVLGLSLVGAMYTLIPRGVRRNQAKLGVTAVMLVAVASGLYSGSESPGDIVAALILGMALPVVVFRWVTPNETFPIRYGKVSSAHLDLGVQRLAAIRRAVEYEVGARVLAVHSLRSQGSSGSTPLRITLRAGDGPEVYLFGKLYALSHLRADRWYKLGRSVLYGRLEDEHGLASVRRLVEHEDYSLRVAESAGIPVPHSLGFVELIPGREYLLLTEWVAAARPVGTGPHDIDVIDQALSVVRGLWEAGIAHRDIKPGNVLMSPAGVRLVDLSFAEMRPSPWREAVDLANMMLVLGLGAEPAVVYSRATMVFDPDEIGEAFAATRSVTIPGELRSALRARRRDLVGEYRELAPRHSPISIQRWSVARLLLTAGMAAAAVLAAVALALNFGRAGLL